MRFQQSNRRIERCRTEALDRNPHHLFASRERIGRWAISSARRSCSQMANNPDLGNERFLLAVESAQAGDLDAAFEQLQRLIDTRDPALIHLAVAPEWDSLRADQRFNQCLTRMQLRPVL
jgi:hypothetical protein